MKKWNIGKDHTIKKCPKSKGTLSGNAHVKIMEMMLSSMSAFSERLIHLHPNWGNPVTFFL